jgi:adenosylmethionine-8-amino-7-oxononanoate aminotransferase
VRPPEESPGVGKEAPPEGGECGLACAAEFERLVEENADRLAAAIVEPVVQAAGGIITMPPGYLRRVWEACRRHGVLFIADEVATGFGRTGKMFACQHEGVAPDLMCVAKGLTGGYLPLAATLVTEEVFAAFLGEEGEFRTFYHGHSYTANQLGCAAALASLDLFQRDRVLEALPRKADLVARHLALLEELPGVGEMRQRGLMVGIEVVRERATKEPFPADWRVGHRVCRRARELGLITRPLGDVVVFMPPLASTEEELSEMAGILVRAVRETLGKLGAR